MAPFYYALAFTCWSTLLPDLVFCKSKSTFGRTYRKCPAGKLYVGTSLYNEMDYASLYTCLFRCSDLVDCLSINVCWMGGTQTVSSPVACHYMTGAVSDIEECTGLWSGGADNCFVMIKYPVDDVTTSAPPETTEVSTSTAMPCQNGGIPDGDGDCLCTPWFAGRYCERYPRDCQEMLENGASINDGGNRWIQPEGGSMMSVSCEFFSDWAYTTVLDWWELSALDLPVKGRPELTSGFIGSDGSFFIGLDNLYHFLQQGEYRLRVELTLDDNNNNTEDLDVDAIYENFTMLPQQDMYQINYTSFSTSNSGDNGWSSVPAFFYSLDQNDACAVSVNADGWMGGDCTGPAKLFNTGQQPLQWPAQGGQLYSVMVLQFNLEKMSSLIDA